MPALRLLLGLLVLLLGLTGAVRARPAAESVALHPHTPAVRMWPHWKQWTNPPASVTPAEAAARHDRYAPPTGPAANLGLGVREAWLRARLRADDPEAGSRWWLVLDYPPLQRVEAYLVGADGTPRLQGVTGREVLLRERLVATRALAIPLRLPPGETVELLVRVRSSGAMLLPASVMSTPELLRTEGGSQMLLGVSLGLSACVVLFAAVQFARTRESTFLWFALSATASQLFSWSLFGMTTLYLWPETAWLAERAPPLLTLLTLGAGFMFVERSLDVRRVAPRTARAMVIGAALAAAFALALSADWIGYKAAAAVALLLSPTPMLLALPLAWRRAREGDRVAAWIFCGWACYGAGVLITTAVTGGRVPLTMWTQNAYSVGGLLQLVCWVNALGAMAAQIRERAEHAQREHQLALQLAHTDPLTRLRNRRGLEAALAPLLAAAHPDRPLALFLIDADGFKTVNDTQGHDAGDEVLRQIAARLTQSIRQDDIVARLGGDEFVVVTPRLGDAAEAQRIGRKLLAAGHEPFDLPAGPARVGLTIGYALAPQSGSDLATLLKQADTALYAGKQAGKGRLCAAAS